MKKLFILPFLIFSIHFLQAQCSTFTAQATMISTISCNGMSDGAAQVNPVGGAMPYTYLWDNGNTNQIAYGLNAGTYTVTVTDDIGCVATAAVSVVEPPALIATVNVTSANCSACDGTAIVIANGGTPPYSYMWTNGNTGVSFNNMCPGTYTVTVTDANGCVAVWPFIVVGNGNTLQSITTALSPVSCSSINDGSAMVTLTGGVAPYLFFWSSGETTATATSLEAGIQTVTISDAAGCTVVDSVTIGDNGVYFSVASTNVSCNTHDGTASVTLNPPITNPIFQWNNGANTPAITGLAPGWYSVTVEDMDTGCRSKKLIEVLLDPSCVVTIVGSVFNDTASPDCIADAATVPLDQMMIRISNGVDSSYTYTDSLGNYSFEVDTGLYTIRLVLFDYYSLACPGSLVNTVHSTVLQTTHQGGDFYLELQPAQDMRTLVFSGPCRPGFIRRVSLSNYNKGTDTMSGTVRFVHDPKLTNFNGFGLEDSYDPVTGTVVYSYSNLLPRHTVKFPIEFLIPASTPLGSMLHDTSTVEPIVGDLVPVDNVHESVRWVTGAYDPNDKQNLVGTDPFGGDFYEDDTNFVYQVRFQNTGTDTAFTVVIRDTLDANLKVETLTMLDASHNYSVRFDGHNILEFWFENILLPDSNVNEPMSHGYVLFSIDREANLPIGTVIENQAAIYFDFNAPILTNTVVNTLAVLLSIGESPTEDQIIPVSVFPNPTSDEVQLGLTLPEATQVQVTVFDMTGKQVSNELNSGYLPEGQQQIQLSTKDLADGSYFIRVKAGSFVGVARLLVVH